MELHEIQQDQPERVLLVSVDTGEFDCAVSLAELADLVDTAGGQVVGTATQKKESPDKNFLPGVYSKYLHYIPNRPEIQAIGQ